MFCSKCGQEINEDAVVCIHCGCAVKGKSLDNQDNNELIKILAIVGFTILALGGIFLSGLIMVGEIFGEG